MLRRKALFPERRVASDKCMVDRIGPFRMKQMVSRKSEPRIIALTGCGGGLGRALVREFATAGHTVAGCSRSREPLSEMAVEYPCKHLFRSVDVSDERAVQAWTEEVLDQIGVPDLLINNAALINAPRPLWEVPADEFQQLMSVNVTGVHHVLRHMVPAMIDAGKGVIVNISSGWGRSVSTDVAPYCASKWAIEGLTRALAEELPEPLAAIPLNPGVIDTPMLRKTWGEGASGHRTPAQWARQAAPYILGLNVSHSGQPLSVPG